MGEPLNHIHQDTESARLIAVCKRSFSDLVEIFSSTGKCLLLSRHVWKFIQKQLENVASSGSINVYDVAVTLKLKKSLLNHLMFVLENRLQKYRIARGV